MTNEELLERVNERIDVSERRVMQHIESTNERIDVSERRVMQLIESHSQELQNLGQQTNNRLDAIQARLDRQGGLLRSGTIWTARMNEWAERIDGLVDNLQRRLDHLERGKNG